MAIILKREIDIHNFIDIEFDNRIQIKDSYSFQPRQRTTCDIVSFTFNDD